MTFCDPNNTETTAGELPWWCLLHYLVCAESILMLEIVHQAASVGSSDTCYTKLLAEARRPMPWLSRVSATDLPAKRTFLQLSKLLNHVAVAVGEHPEYDEPHAADDDMFAEPIWLTPDMGFGVGGSGIHVYDHDMDALLSAGHDHISSADDLVVNPWDGPGRRAEGTEGGGA